MLKKIKKIVSLQKKQKMPTQYETLIQKLENFKKKYYQNSLLRGIIFFLISTLLFSFLIIFFSYFFVENTNFRRIILIFSVFSLLFFFSFFVLVPILRLIKISKTISHKEASSLIAKYFSDVQDKLLNILELSNDFPDNKIALASIDKKILELKPIEFKKAVRFKTNFKFVKYLLVVLFLFGLTYIVNPLILNVGSDKIINPSLEIIEPQPFYIILKNKKLTAEKGKNLTIDVTTEGKIRPDEIYIEYNSSQFLLKKDKRGNFNYEFKNLNNDINFQLIAGDIKSKKFSVKILEPPIIKKYFVEVIKPKHTHQKNEIIVNTGDIIVPEGSILKWNFLSENTDAVSINFDDKKTLQLKEEDNLFVLSKRIMKETLYKVNIKNSHFTKKAILKHKITTVKDLFPEINIRYNVDSITNSTIYFQGKIQDDYGFSSLKFYYLSDTLKKFIKLPINKQLTSQQFEFEFNINDYLPDTEGEMKFYFVLADNDIVNSFKKTKSVVISFKKPTKEEINKQIKKTNKDIEEDIKNSKDLISELQKDLQKLKEAKAKKMSSWQKEKLYKSIKEKTSELEKLMDMINKDMQTKENLSKNQQKQLDEVKEKQKELRDLMEKLMDEEMKKLIDELNKLLEKEEQKIDEKTEKFDKKLEQISEQLDKNLELFKKMQVEEKVMEITEELDEEAKKMEELKEKMKQAKKNELDALKEKQKELNKDVHKTLDKLDDLQKKNKELKKPMKMPDTEQQKQDLQQEMQKMQQEMQNNRKKKTSESQDKAKHKIETLSFSLQSMMQKENENLLKKSEDELRKLLSNIIEFSFKQEQITEATKKTKTTDPNYNKLAAKQNKIKYNYNAIKDSLISLAEQLPVINKAVFDELYKIENNLEQVNENMLKFKYSRTNINQRNILTASNELALLISEIIKSMQQQSKGGKGGEGQKQCKNPQSAGDSKKKSFKKMEQMSKSMKKQLQDMINEMKKNGGKKMSGQLSKMLSEKEKLQKMLSDHMRKNSLSPESMKQLNEIKALLDKNIKDIANKKLDNLMKRQNQILDKFLKADNAENEKEKDEQRKSKTAQEIENNNKTKEIKFKINKENYKENLDNTPIKLNKYYNTKYNLYKNK